MVDFQFPDVFHRYLDLVVFLLPDGVLDLHDQALGDDVVFVAELHGRVLEFGMEAHRQVRRQGPGRRGPDDDIGIVRVHAGNLHGRRVDLEFHEDGRRRVVGVFDLRFRQRGHAGGAPVDRLLAPVDVSLFKDLPEDLDDRGLVLGGHGLVGVFVIAEHAQALELLHLDLDELIREHAAEVTDLFFRHGFGFYAQLAHDVVLDGQAVAVPARDIGGLEAHHGLMLHDDVFQYLVQGMAHVKVPVGVRGAVMQDVELLAGTRFLYLCRRFFPFPIL